MTAPAPDWLRYQNQGATRSLPISPRLTSALGFLPEMGVTMEVFSGGQPKAGGGPRVGSTRHDHGEAADVFFIKDGRRLNWADPNDRPIFQDIVRRAKANGVTGFGAGEGYMQPGSMHIGFGEPAVWGAGGKGANAPGWLRAAYEGNVKVADAGGGNAALSYLRMRRESAPPPPEAQTASEGAASYLRMRRERAEAASAPEQGPAPAPATVGSRVEAVGRGALQGATLGFSDEIAGGTIDQKTYQENYIALRQQGVPHAEAEQQARQSGFDAAGARTEEVRAANEASQAQHPGYYAGGEIGGAVASAVVPVGGAVGAATRAASLGGKMVRGGGVGIPTGAAVGAVDAAGRAEGGAGERLDAAGEGAMWGAGLGGVFGALAPAVGAGVRRIVENVRMRPDMKAARDMGTSPAAAEIAAEMIRSDDPARAVGRIARAGDGAMLADAGEATGGLLDTAMQKAGAGGGVGRRAIEERSILAARDVSEALDNALGPVTGPTKPATGRLSAVYDAAYRTPIDYSGSRGRALEGLLPRIPGDIINRANRLMQVSGEKSKQIMAEIADDGAVTFTEMPDVRQLDYITRALNDVAKRGDGQGALGGNTAEGRAYGNLAREIRGILKEEVPAYKAALNVAATEIGQKEARELGEVALRTSTTRGDLFEAISDMGAIEKRKLAEGVRSHIDDLLARVKRTQGSAETEGREGWKAISELSSRESQDKLAMIVGKEEAKRLVAKLDRASTAFELQSRTTRGAQTFGRQSMDAAMKARLDPGALGKLLEMSPGAAARRLGQSFTGMTPQARQKAEEEFAGEVASLLTGARGKAAQAQAQELVKMLDRSAETARIAKIVERRVAQGAGTVGFAASTRLTAE